MIGGTFLINFIGVIVALVVILITYLKWSWTYWNKKGVPTIEQTIPFGNMVNPFKMKKLFAAYFADYYHAMKAKGHKHVGLYMWARPIYMVIDLEYLKNIVQKDFQHFVDRGFYYDEKNDPLSAHLFALGGNKWRNLRRKLTPTFTSGKMRSMFKMVVDCGTILEKVMLDINKKQEPIDIRESLARFTTDVIGTCAFGLEFNSFEDEDAPFRYYGKRVFDAPIIRTILLAFFINFPKLGKLFGFTQVTRDITDFFMNAVRDTVKHREKNNIVRKDFLQLLIDMKNNNNAETVQDNNSGDGNTLTINEIAAQCFVFFIAGYDTSSTTMNFALYEMARNQDIQDKVREEMNTVLEKYNGEITYDAIFEMKYLGQVIDESLRMYPPIPQITRECVLDYKIPETNIVIEKGTRIFIPIYGIHYDAEYFPEPYEFNPDRFSEKNRQFLKEFSYIPFGEGNRMCIGMRFGLMQSKIGLITLLRKFKFTVNPKTKEPIETDPRSFITNAKGGIWLNSEEI